MILQHENAMNWLSSGLNLPEENVHKTSLKNEYFFVGWQ